MSQSDSKRLEFSPCPAVAESQTSWCVKQAYTLPQTSSRALQWCIVADFKINDLR